MFSSETNTDDWELNPCKLYPTVDDQIRCLLKIDLQGFELYKYLEDNNIRVTKTKPLTLQVSDG